MLIVSFLEHCNYTYFFLQEFRDTFVKGNFLAQFNFRFDTDDPENTDYIFDQNKCKDFALQVQRWPYKKSRLKNWPENSEF